MSLHKYKEPQRVILQMPLTTYGCAILRCCAKGNNILRSPEAPAVHRQLLFHIMKQDPIQKSICRREPEF